MSPIISGNFYQSQASLFQRFGYHVVLGLKKELGSREDCKKNLLEKTGDIGLWIVESLPHIIWQGIKDPRVVTVALTALALLATSLIFYPTITFLLIKNAIAFIPFPPFWALRFSAYLLTVTLILASACRAQGRFWNKQLMNHFYGNT